MNLLPTHRPVSLRQQVGRTVTWNLVTVLAFGVGFLGVALHTDGEAVPGPEAHSEQATQSPVQRLLEDNKCWSGEAPRDMAGKMPGHVVYAKGSTGPKLGSNKAVGKALEQIFEGTDHGFIVYGFCR